MVADRHAQARYAARQQAADPEGWRARRRAARRRWRIANREKDTAQVLARRAVRTGRLTRPDGCQRCGAVGKPEASHDDYSKPLAVEWLCRLCHAQKDMGRRV